MARKKSATRPAFMVTPTYGWTTYPPSNLTKRFQKAAKKIGKLHEKLKFDAIAFTGSSGAALGFVLGIAMNLPVLYIRKDNESDHGKEIECNSRGEITKYLIVDDFIFSGNTVRRIIGRIEKYGERNNMKPPTCVGIFVYDDRASRNFIYDEKVIRVFR